MNSPSSHPPLAETPPIRVGVIGCGNVSAPYFADLARSPFVRLISACDRIVERAERAARTHGIPNHYADSEAMLAGAAFDLLVNLTDMQEHGRLNRRALQAGKHVWSEKPLASSAEEGRELLTLARQNGVRLWGAPSVVCSPQFAFLAETIASGKLGQIAGAHAAYGHGGPDWSSFFYESGGGSLPDLGVYSLTTLTGLLGPATEVVAMTGIVTPTRTINAINNGHVDCAVRVAAEDNAMVLMRHQSGALSHVQSGFSYFSAETHDDVTQSDYTLSILGTQGVMHLCGYDWGPHGVDLATREQPKLARFAQDAGDYAWQGGASHVARCLATGNESPITPEHALHVLEIIEAARASQQSGRRITLTSTFRGGISPHDEETNS